MGLPLSHRWRSLAFLERARAKAQAPALVTQLKLRGEQAGVGGGVGRGERRGGVSRTAVTAPPTRASRPHSPERQPLQVLVLSEAFRHCLGRRVSHGVVVGREDAEVPVDPQHVAQGNAALVRDEVGVHPEDLQGGVVLTSLRQRLGSVVADLRDWGQSRLERSSLCACPSGRVDAVKGSCQE